MKFNLKSFRLGDFLSKRINTILLIVILIIILTGHVVCSCSKVSVKKVVEKFTAPPPPMGSAKGPAMGPNLVPLMVLLVVPLVVPLMVLLMVLLL